jgi:hypothetical protein
VEIKNGKFWTNDFKVYYLATQDFFSGGNPYWKPYGLDSGFFKYPPTTLYFFAPVFALNYFTAQIVHTLILWLSLTISIALLHETFIIGIKKGLPKKRYGILYLSFALIAVHVVRELYLGNVNLILLLLFVSGIVAYINQRSAWMVFCWSLMVILKPIVVITFLPMLFLAQWKLIAQMVGLGLLFFLLPFIHLGAEAMDLWANWFKAISAHGDYIISENSLTYLANYYFDFESAWGPSIFILAFLICLMIVERLLKPEPKQFFISWVVILLAFTPNFFVTDTEHFLLGLPLVLLLLREIITAQNNYLYIPFVMLVVGFSLKSNDLWGKQLSAYFNEIGFLGFSNLGLIIFFIIIRQFNFRDKISPKVA